MQIIDIRIESYGCIIDLSGQDAALIIASDDGKILYPCSAFRSAKTITGFEAVPDTPDDPSSRATLFLNTKSDQSCVGQCSNLSEATEIARTLNDYLLKRGAPINTRLYPSFTPAKSPKSETIAPA